jgi:hypothetical protein
MLSCAHSENGTQGQCRDYPFGCDKSSAKLGIQRAIVPKTSNDKSILAERFRANTR